MSIVKPSFYKQSDSRWATKGWRTTDGGFSQVGPAGCGSTSIANIVNASIKSITPPVVFKYACKHGYQTGNSGMYSSGIPAILKHYGVEVIETLPRNSEGKAQLKKYLRKNYWAVALMGPGIWTRGGHYIVAYYVDSNNNVYISDPASSVDYRQKNNFDTFWNQQKATSWVVIKPHKTAKKKTTSTQPKTYTFYISYKVANIRAGRGKEYKVVGTLKKNTTIKVKNLKSGWWQIASGKYKGKYISSKGVSKYKSHTINYKTLYDMNVRDGYTTKANKIAEVPKGTKLKSTKQRGRWAYFPKQKGLDKAGFICAKTSDGKKRYLEKI